MSGDAPRRPLRPSLPPVLWTAIAVWVGLCVAELVGWWVYRETVSSAMVVLVPSTAVVAAVLLRRTAVGHVAVGLAAGLIVGAVFWSAWAVRAQVVMRPVSGERSVVVVGDPRTSAFGSVSRVRVLVGDQWVACDAFWPRDEPAPVAGRIGTVRGRFARIGDDERARRSHMAGTMGSFRVDGVGSWRWRPGFVGAVSRLRWSCRRRIDRVSGAGADLVCGVVLGDRGRLTGQPAEADYRTCGLTHLVAVSGGHLVVVAAVFVAMARMAGVSRRVHIPVTMAAVGAYVIFSGTQASAVRAWLMTLPVVAASAAGRRSDGAASLGGAAAGFLLLSPPVAFDVGFALSVASVAGLVLFARLAQEWVAAILPHAGERFAGPLALTLVAQAATAPLAAGVFGTFSVIAPVANLFAGPLVSVVLVVGIAGFAVSAVSQGLGEMLLRCASTVGESVAWLAAKLAAAPWASIEVSGGMALNVATVLCAAVVWIAWPRPRIRVVRAGAIVAILAAALSLMGSAPPSGPTVTVLDVGQGDAIVVRDGDAVALLDTGPRPETLAAALRAERVDHVDALLLSHLHEDHAGGLPALSGGLAPKTVMLARGGADEARDALREAGVAKPVRELGLGDTVHVGRVTLQVVWPRAKVDDVNDNGSCLTVLARCGDAEVLLTGDAEAAEVAAAGRGAGLSDIDVLKVGHHGSAASVDDGLLGMLTPQAAVISVGADNRYGHPAPGTLERLRARCARVLRTDRDGSIRISLSGSQARIL